MTSHRYTFNVQFLGNDGFVGIESSTVLIGFATEDNCLGILNDSIYKQFSVLGGIRDISAEITVKNGYVYLALSDGLKYTRVYKEVQVGVHKFTHRGCIVTNLDICPSKYRIKRHSTSAVGATQFTVRCQRPFSVSIANFVSGDQPNKIRIYKGNIINLSVIMEATHDEFAYTTAEISSRAMLLHILFAKPYSSVVYEGHTIRCSPDEFLLFVADWPVRMYFGFAKKIYKQQEPDPFPPYEMDFEGWANNSATSQNSQWTRPNFDST